jgi:hypothetical protein
LKLKEREMGRRDEGEMGEGRGETKERRVKAAVDKEGGKDEEVKR